MQIPTRCSRLEDAAWGVGAAVALLMVLPLLPLAVAVSLIGGRAHG